MTRISRTMIITEHAEPMTELDEALEKIKDFPRKKVAVAVAEDPASLEAVREAQARDVADYCLVGDREIILRQASAIGWEPDPSVIVNVRRPVDAAREAVRVVHDGECDILMKGYIHTDDFLRAVLDKEIGLRTKAVMSHVFIWEATQYGKLVFVTDAAMNIAPDVVMKADIILNAVHLAGMFGIFRPKVAVLAAVEVVNPRMPATLDAAALLAMCERRQFSVSCDVDGPFALDNALSAHAAKVKKMTGPVAGQADILVCPDIEAGNMLAKSFVYLAGGRMAGVLVGARVPVVLTSRADSADAKLYSIATAVLMSGFERDLELKIGKVHF